VAAPLALAALAPDADEEADLADDVVAGLGAVVPPAVCVVEGPVLTAGVVAAGAAVGASDALLI
jgi:hypothetical protein